MQLIWFTNNVSRFSGIFFIDFQWREIAVISPSKFSIVTFQRKLGPTFLTNEHLHSKKIASYKEKPIFSNKLLVMFEILTCKNNPKKCGPFSYNDILEC